MDRTGFESNSSQTVSSLGGLYKDVLQHIFTFLDWNEFVPTCMVHPNFYAAGRTMKSFGHSLTYSDSILPLVQSPLRFHITHLDLQGYDQLDLKDLLLLKQHMNHLEELEAMFKIQSAVHLVQDLPIDFPIPTHLTALRMNFEVSLEEANQTTLDRLRSFLSDCLKAIATQSTCLGRLQVDFSAWSGVPQSFEIECLEELRPMISNCLEELRSMVTLTDLTLPDCCINQQIDLIKLLPSIRRWRPPQLSVEQIQRLVDGSVPPHLEDVGSFSYICDSKAVPLRKLTSLTKLVVFAWDLYDPTQLLPYLPRLTILELNCRCVDSADVDQLAIALSSCAALAELAVAHPQLANKHLCHFLSHIVSLVRLKLHGCYSLTSLEFLTKAKSNLAKLRSFSIYGADRLHKVQYDRHLPSIATSLESLTIWNSSTKKFNPLRIARWTPGSPEFNHEEWPQLKEFDLTQNQVDSGLESESESEEAEEEVEAEDEEEEEFNNGQLDLDSHNDCVEESESTLELI